MVDLASRLAGHATATALVEGEARISYAELSDRVLRTAAGLRAVATPDHGRIGVVAASTVDGVVAYLGTQAAGLVPVMLSPRAPEIETAGRLDDVGTDIVLVASDRYEVPDGVTLHRPSGSVAEDAPVLDADPSGAVSVTSTDTAVVLYTSGVSGLPRAIALSYGNLSATREGLVNAPGGRLDSRTIAYGGLPMSHVFGLNSVLGSVLRAGGKVVLNDAFDAEAMVELVARHRITALAAVPLIWKGLAAIGSEHHFETVSRATYAAAPLPPAVADAVRSALGLRISGGFGLTETAGTVVHDDVSDPTAGSVGRPLGHTELRIVDTDGFDALPGDFGEIWLRGPSLAERYVDGTPLESEGDGWFCTGDVGVLDDEGRVSIVDRKKDVINVGGFNVSPAEVEHALSQHPDVSTSVVVGELGDDTEVAVAHVVPVPGRVIVEAELIEHCRGLLSRYKVPSRVFVHSELPVTESGKAVRRLLGRV